MPAVDVSTAQTILSISLAVGIICIVVGFAKRKKMEGSKDLAREEKLNDSEVTEDNAEISQADKRLAADQQQLAGEKTIFDETDYEEKLGIRIEQIEEAMASGQGNEEALRQELVGYLNQETKIENDLKARINALLNTDKAQLKETKAGEKTRRKLNRKEVLEEHHEEHEIRATQEEGQLDQVERQITGDDKIILDSEVREESAEKDELKVLKKENSDVTKDEKESRAELKIASGKININALRKAANKRKQRLSRRETDKKMISRAAQDTRRAAESAYKQKQGALRNRQLASQAKGLAEAAKRKVK
jgi:hypothetical protein